MTFADPVGDHMGATDYVGPNGPNGGTGPQMQKSTPLQHVFESGLRVPKVDVTWVREIWSREQGPDSDAPRFTEKVLAADVVEYYDVVDLYAHWALRGLKPSKEM